MPIDWTNGFWMPLAMACTIGVALSIYTGLLASRLFAFFQVRGKSVNWLFDLGAFFGTDHQSPHDFSIKLGQATYGIMNEMRGLGHENAKQHMASIFRAYLVRCSELLGVGWPNEGLPEFPDFAGDLDPRSGARLAWMIRMDHLRNYYRVRLGSDAAKLASLWPNLGALLNPWPFPNYYSSNGDIVGLLDRRPSGWFRFVSWCKRVWQRVNIDVG